MYNLTVLFLFIYFIYFIYLRTSTSGKVHCITNLWTQWRGQNHLPGHEPIIHRKQITGRGEVIRDYFFHLIVLYNFARNGKLLFWNLLVLHLYSLTLVPPCLVLKWFTSIENIEFSLFAFFTANFWHNLVRLSSRDSAPRVAQANW